MMRVNTLRDFLLQARLVQLVQLVVRQGTLEMTSQDPF